MMRNKIIFLGAPGSGKGTQSAILSEALDIPTISTGNILRAEIKEGSPLGLEVKAVIESGALVNDELILSILAKRLSQPDCAKGYILDGVPRTIAQAEGMEKLGIEINCVISLQIDDQKVIERMVGRRVCAKCGATFHEQFNKPKVSGVCDSCQGELAQRKDDKAETVTERLKVYYQETAPLEAFYQERGAVHQVADRPSIDDMAAA
ncbi:MAG: adenylate kinase, partial [Eubacteriales bacterium]